MAYLKRGNSVVQGALDYEEGAWTPTFSNASSSYPPVGQYIKTGKLVHCWGWILTDGGTSGTTFGGLPFTSATSGTIGNAQGCGTTGYQNTSDDYSQFGTYVAHNAKTFIFAYVSSSVDFGADKQALFNIFYRID
tara:strand:- start:484 stop:888 length:405 start_codon:yes stop_codon:yes gene_type:complete